MHGPTSRLGVTVAVGLTLLTFASTAAGEQYKDKSAAAAAGDPAATAKSVELPEAFAYEGKRIDAQEAQAKGLWCVQDADGVTCRNPSGKTSSTSKARASQTYNCSSLQVLSLFQYAQTTACLYTGNGWRLDLQGRQNWYNMGSYSNEASAYYMGNHSGHMSEFNDGNGYWVPYATGVNDYMLSLNGTGWSDRIDSRYRN